MKVVRVKGFPSPEVLQKIRGDLLLAWLHPARDYLQKRGLGWPAFATPPGEGSPRPDLDHLARILAEPNAEQPAYLADSLFMIKGMANEDGMNLMLSEARRQGFMADLEDSESPADVAVRFWLKHPGELEDLHNCCVLMRPRSYHYFHANLAPEEPGPEPDPEGIAKLERRLGAFFAGWWRGNSARVFQYRLRDEWLFLIRHGGPLQREPVLEGDEPASISFRPQCHDVLRYLPGRRELGVHCCFALELRVLLRLVGICLFKRANFFAGADFYTLAPVLKHGRACLACADVPGIEKVQLQQIEIAHRGIPQLVSRHSAEDIFKAVESGDLELPARAEALTRATFEMRLRGSRRTRRLTLIPGHKALYSHDEDSGVMERWIVAREFKEFRPVPYPLRGLSTLFQLEAQQPTQPVGPSQPAKE